MLDTDERPRAARRGARAGAGRGAGPWSAPRSRPRSRTRSRAVFASRLAGDRWFAWEQPDRRRLRARRARLRPRGGLARPGPVRRPDRRLRRRSPATGSRASRPGLPAGAGPVWTGGLRVRSTTGPRRRPGRRSRRRCWCSPSSRCCAVRPQTWLTLAAVVSAGGDRARGRAGRLERRLASLREEPLPLLDPHPRGATTIRSVAPPSRYEDDRRRGGRADPRRRARQGRARARGRGRGAGGARPGAGLRRPARALRAPASASASARPRARSSAPARSCSSAAAAPARRPSRSPARPGAAPTLRSTTTSASSSCTAPRTGSSTRSSPGGSSARSRPRSVWVEAEREPRVIKVANIQHLATAGPRPARRAALGGRARRAHAPDPRGRRRARGDARRG